MALKTGTVTVDTATPPNDNLGLVFYTYLANITGVDPGHTATQFVAHSDGLDTGTATDDVSLTESDEASSDDEEAA